MDYSQLDDSALLRLIMDHQTTALNELYSRYGRLIFSVALQIVGERAAAEEITLDIFTKVWEKANTYRSDRGKVRVWLTSMTRNRAIDILRRDNVRLNTQRALWAEMASSSGAIERNPEMMVDLGMRKESVRLAISQLTEAQRDVLALAYFQGYTQSEIAQLRDLPLGTVKTRVRSAIQKLRTLLQEEFLNE